MADFLLEYLQYKMGYGREEFYNVNILFLVKSDLKDSRD